MFGIGVQELLIIGLLCLIVFGPGKLPGMARDLGRFVSGAHDTVEEFKDELLSGEVEEARRSVEQFKGEVLPEELDEVRRAVEEIESELVPSGENRNEAVRSTPLASDEARVREREER